jgi:FkbM family methyltransferase
MMVPTATRRTMVINRFLKYLTAAAQPAYWPAMARGVMPTVEHVAALSTLNPRTVFDVGANRGQFSVVARHLFPSAQIFAFEPLEVDRRFYQLVVRGPVRMQALALGAARGRTKFFVTSRADSSSLLAPTKKQESAYGVGLASTTMVEVERLEDVIRPEDIAPPALLKLDVQGAELQVLQGGGKILRMIEMIYCEVSFVELYERQPNAGSVVSFLADRGFELRGVFNLSKTSEFGHTQADMLFIR